MSRLSQSGNISGRSTQTRSEVLSGLVLDVILDENHPAVTSHGISSEVFGPKNTGKIGSAKIRRMDDNTTSLADLKFIRPMDVASIELPLIGETVELVRLSSGKYVYKRMPSSDINSNSVKNNPNSLINPDKEKTPKGKSDDYSTTSQTGTPNSSASGTDDDPKNEYFEATQINPLQFHEGDKVIQSRFGQSIRFSGYNNVDNVLAPTIIIRNRQGDKSLDELKEQEFLLEDIVDDGSTIVMASGDHLLEFIPGTLDTPLETAPIYAEEPELKGTDQVLINSGRIILSSKDSEMLFYSKGNYSFISDGKLTIDNGLDGAEMDFNGDVLITTNDNNFTINPKGGTGEIYLNTESTDEPLVRGETLLDLMEQLIDAINKQVFSTPSGPTALGPNNRSDFNSIKSKLSDFLSTLNYTE